MPNLLSLLTAALLGVVATIICYKVAKKRKSNMLYVISLGYMYLTEIFIMYFLFVYFLSSTSLPFNYKETSSVKVFIDFFTIYQIGVIVYIRSTDNFISRPYHEYILQLKRIQVRFESEDWEGLEKLWDIHKKGKPNYLFNTRIENAHEDTYNFLNEIVIAKKICAYIDLIDMEKDFYDERIKDFRNHLNNEILIYERHFEHLNSHWSGSIFLRYNRLPIAVYQEIKTMIGKRVWIQDIINFLSTYHLVIFNVIVMIMFILTYYYFKVSLLYY